MTRYIVEADGGSRGNPGPAGYGAVVIDAESGEVLAEVARHIGHATNNVAEYSGLIAGLEAARDLDPDAEVTVRMDSKLVVEQMSGRWQIKNPGLRPLALEARRILPPERVTFTWIPREQNTTADRLANEAMDDAAAGRNWSRRSAGRTPAQPGAAVEPEVDEAEVEPPPANRLPGFGPDAGVPTTFVLLRHGATEHTLEKRFSGLGGDDPPLAESGVRQAQLAAEALRAGPQVDAIVTSPLRRARQTADAVARALDMDVRVEDGFAEWAFGDWDGLTFAEVKQRWPDELQAWLDSTTVAPPGDGESFEAVSRRVALARDKTMARYPGRRVLVVTHVTPLKELVRLALAAPVASHFRMELDPASFTCVQWWSDGLGSLRYFNETAHLRPS